MGTCGYSYNPPKKTKNTSKQFFADRFAPELPEYSSPKKPFRCLFFAPEWQWPTDSIGGLHCSTFFLVPLTLQISLIWQIWPPGWLEKIGLDLDDPYLDLLKMSMFLFFGWKGKQFTHLEDHIRQEEETLDNGQTYVKFQLLTA